tara:strand:- start:124 stop:411 length:288 start_codon:yes stop_codon:yes gene_type:complete
MILKKLILTIFILGLFNGCVQNTVFLGPAYTLTSTGNLFQAGLSYGSSKAVTSTTGKTTGEHIKNFLQPREEDSDFRKLVEQRIIKTRKIMNLNQ